MFKSLLMSALVLTAGAFVACTNNDGGDDKPFEGMPEISATADVDVLTLEGGVVTVNVVSNAPWTATVDAEDVTVSPAKGNGNATVTVTVPAATAARDVKVSFVAVGSMMGVELTDDAQVSISQNAAGKFLISGITPEAVGDGAEFSLEEVLVTAVGTQAYVIADESGAMIVFHNGHGRTVGEKINISGQVTVYKSDSGSIGTPQFGNTATVTVVSTGNEVTHNPTLLDAAAFDALLNEPVSKEVEFTATWEVSGTYVNLAVEGATNKGSVKYIDNAAYADFAGQTVIIKGYSVGFSKSGNTYYVNVMPYSIELDPNAPVLNVDKSELTFKADDSSRNNQQTFTITTNDLAGYTLSWAIDNETDFALGRQIPGGNSRATLYCHPKAANTGSVKTANVTITYTNGTKTLTKSVKVVQESNSAANATFDMAELYGGQDRGSVVGTKTVDGISIAWDKGENSNDAKIYDGVVRAYATNSFTLSGATITNVEVVYGLGQGTNTVSTDAGTYTEATDLLSGAWTGSAQSVKFTVDKTADGKTSGQRRVVKIVVTYAK